MVCSLTRHNKYKVWFAPLPDTGGGLTQEEGIVLYDFDCFVFSLFFESFFFWPTLTPTFNRDFKKLKIR